MLAHGLHHFNEAKAIKSLNRSWGLDDEWFPSTDESQCRASVFELLFKYENMNFYSWELFLNDLLFLRNMCANVFE